MKIVKLVNVVYFHRYFTGNFAGKFRTGHFKDLSNMAGIFAPHSLVSDAFRFYE